MKIIKRIFLIIIIISVLFTAALLAYSFIGSNSEFEFELNSDGESYTCLGFKDGKSAAEAVIPETYKKKPVTAIGANAFTENVLSNMYNEFYGGSSDKGEKVPLTSVTIPNSVTSIGAGAFCDCVELKTYNLPANLTYIGANAFLRTGISGEVKIPDSVTEIGESAFSATDITSVTLPKNLTVIAPSLFAGCNKITSVTMGDAITSIGANAFYGCELLTTFEFPASLEAIGAKAFGGCIGFTELTIPSTITYLDSQIFVDTSEALVVNVSYDSEKPEGWSDYWFGGMKGKAINTSEVYYNTVVLAEQEKAASLMQSLESYENQYKSYEEQIEGEAARLKSMQAAASINPSDYQLDAINNLQKEINQLNRSKAEIASKISEIKEELKAFKITNQLN